eukprot:3441174-Prymnesium_polylepis.1
MVFSNTQSEVWRGCGHQAGRRGRSVHSFAESREIVLLGRLKPLFNVCARLTKYRPAPLSQANLDGGRAIKPS